MTVKIYKPYGQKRRILQTFKKPSRTKQSMAAECDINNIMSKYNKTGLVSHVNEHKGQYGDATGVDFQHAQNMIIEATETFASLPANLRKEFDNDPSQFLAFVSDDNNIDAMRELGLLPEEPKQAPQSVSEVAPQQAAEETDKPPEGA